MKDDNRMIILDEYMCQGESINCEKKVAVVVFLYYTDTVDEYFEYINNVPNWIDIYIISSNPEIYGKVQEYVNCSNNKFFVKKNNRGRDISALLVIAREIVVRYEFFCFVHDKKAHKNDLTHIGVVEDTNLWVLNLWDNVMISKQYIHNVLDLFQNEKIGLLVPPAPVGRYRDEWYALEWGENYTNTKKLAERLGLKCEVSLEEPPMTLGSVFWCRTNALKKLIEIEWKYDDFPEEPLALDGTISHAIERILAYVAIDAGYECKVIMCESYAQRMLSFSNMALQESFGLLKEEYGITKLYQIERFNEQREIVKKFFESYDNVFLYGAGKIGKDFLKTLKKWGLEPKGFIVSKGKRIEHIYKNIVVYEIEEVKDKENIGIIVTVRFDLQDLLIKNLKEYGFKNYIKCYFDV